MAYTSYSRRAPGHHRIKRLLFALVPLAIIGGVIYWVTVGGDRAEAPSDEQEAAQQKPTYTAPDLQPVIDNWLAEQAYDYNILIKDRQSGTVIASHNPDKIDLGASFYKLFAVYLTYLDIQDGTRNPDALLSGGRTWLECIDPMIRVSDNDCGEAMVIKMGVSALHDRLVALGMPNTTFNRTHTTAADTLKILELLYDGVNLQEENHQAILDALLNQPEEYKQGLQAGAPEGKWYSKAGWNVGALYNDAALLVLPDGHEFTVVIMGPESYNPDTIANFGKTVYQALTAN